MQSRSISKLIALFGSLLLLQNVALSQYTPPSYDPNIPKNYIRTWDATAPESDPNTLMTRLLKDVKQTTAYFDGLGRPLQTVAKQGSYETNGTALDLVNPVYYDQFGRETYKYLSFVSTATDGTQNNGLFKLNPFQQQASFMSSQYGTGETWYYSQAVYEASPLNRVLESFAPGNSWNGTSIQPNEADRHSIKMKYWFNTPTDDVKKWNVTDVANSFGTYAVTGGFYPAGELYKNVTVDEHGKQVIEFKDKEGRVILKKIQLTALLDDGTGKNYDGWLCTYYIYDYLNNLRCVIQPEGVKTLAGPANWDLNYSSGVLLNEQCFRYAYDERNRMVLKKVPGAGEVWMVYDARDRLVLTQDANLRAQGKWMYTLYDNDLNRPTSTGLWTNGNDRVYHKGLASASIAYPSLSGQTYEELTVNFYDSYTWLSTYGNPLPSSYSNTYDTYFQTVSGTWPYPQANSQTSQLKGLATGSRIKILGTSNYLYTVNFYDEKGRVIQVQGANITGGIDIITTQYSWAGQPLVMVQKKQKSGTNAQTTVIVTQNTYDDLGRLVKTEKKQSNTFVNGNAMSSYKAISQLEYDKLGQLKTKKLAPAYNSNAGLETLTYDYNIRGWMLGANRAYLATTGQNGSTKFGFELGYDKITNSSGRNFQGAGMFNGNITGMIWKSDGDDVKRKYDFTYDAANRILKGVFEQDDAAASWNSTTMKYDMQMGNGTDPLTAYDANGNIKAMTQYGWKIGAPTGMIDNLTYSYFSSSNRLQGVADAITADNKLGDFTDKNTTATDYGYDKNGNLITDLNKRMNGTTGSELTSGGAITYNHLNLPATIAVKNDNGTDKGTIVYMYDAAGSKLQKVTTENNATVFLNGTNYTNVTITTTTTYIGGFVYETKTYSNGALSSLQYTDKLQFVGHEEGRMRGLYDNAASPNLLTGFAYDYMIKDHLGNVRMLLTEEQKQSIYPAATLEGTYSDANTAVGYEKTFYTIDQTKIVNQSDATGITAYPNNNGISNPYPSGNSGNTNVNSNSQKLYKLNATTNKTGLGITLKVMAGDKIDIFGKSYYFQNNSGDNSSYNLPTLDLIGALLGSPGGSVTNSHGTVTATDINNISGSNIGGFLTNSPRIPTTSSTPRAYINYIILDEQFKYRGGGFSPVGSNSAVKSHYNDASMQNIPIEKNGYVFVYCSNESPVNVFFDNLQVVHTRGPILEETHYYPFGLVMSGISSKAIAFGQPENQKKFNGIEHTTEFELNTYDAFFRNADPQIGRWWQIDPKAEEFYNQTPYNSNFSNPISNSDPLGDCPPCFWFAARWLAQRAIVAFAVGATTSIVTQVAVNTIVYGDFEKAVKNIDWIDAAADGTINVITGGAGTFRTLFSKGSSILNVTKKFSVLSLELISATTDLKFEDGDLKIKSVFNGDKSTFDVVSSMVLSLGGNFSADQIKTMAKKWASMDKLPSNFAPKTKAEKEMILKIDKLVKSKEFEATIDGTSSFMSKFIDAILTSNVSMQVKKLYDNSLITVPKRNIIDNASIKSNNGNGGGF